MFAKQITEKGSFDEINYNFNFRPRRGYLEYFQEAAFKLYSTQEFRKRLLKKTHFRSES